MSIISIAHARNGSSTPRAGRLGPTNLLAVTLVFAAVSLSLVAGVTPAAAQSGQFAIVFATGGLGDQSFNDSAFAGVQEAEARFGVRFTWAEPTAVAEYEALLTRFAQRGNYDLIISIGFDQADAVSAVAARFPQQRFAIVDAVAEGDNVASYVYREAERGFLLGAIAGLMTQQTGDPKVNEANIIGVVGGMDIPLINASIAGYMAGAKYVNPAADVRYSYVGDWADPARGKELAARAVRPRRRRYLGSCGAVRFGRHPSGARSRPLRLRRRRRSEPSRARARSHQRHEIRQQHGPPRRSNRPQR